MNAAPDWLHNAIVSGVQNLYALSLPNAPASEVLPMTVEVWSRTIASMPIAWDQRMDERRISAAFLHLAATCDRWPNPKLLLSNLPARPEPLRLAPPAHEAKPVPGWVREKLEALAGRLRLGRPEREAADVAEAERLAAEAHRQQEIARS